MTGCSEGITAHKCKLTKTVATTGQCLPQHVVSDNGTVFAATRLKRSKQWSRAQLWTTYFIISFMLYYFTVM